jgi:thioredoxin 1
MEINQEELRKKIESGEKIILDVFALWCGPCMVMKPTFEKVAQELINENSDVKLYTLNVDDNREIAVEYGVRSVPTIKIFNQGKVIDTKVGVQSETQLKSMVKLLTNE